MFAGSLAVSERDLGSNCMRVTPSVGQNATVSRDQFAKVTIMIRNIVENNLWAQRGRESVGRAEVLGSLSQKQVKNRPNDLR